MTQTDRVALACPACTPHVETAHEVLKRGGQSTVRCTECGHVHKTRIERSTTVSQDVIVSQDGQSYRTSLETDPDETVVVGDEFLVETPEAIQQVRVTSIELEDDQRVEDARVDDVRTVWTRVVDNVSVPVTIHPSDGQRDESRSVRMRVPGDYEFVVGETASVGDEEFEIRGLEVRDAVAEKYRFDRFDHDGDSVFAKDLKRVYARDTTTDPWSGW